jgi:glycosyltransferase involved in cell wall biosynthesis
VEWGWSEEQVIYIPNFVTNKRLAVQRKPQVVYVGRLVEEKGVDVLVAAATLLQQRVPELRIVIAGKGPLEEVLRAEIAAGEVTNIEMRGFVSGADLEQLIAFCAEESITSSLSKRTIGFTI